MAATVSAAQAKATLSALMAKVASGGEHVIIERRGKPYAALVSVDDAALIEQERATATCPQGALALAGAWGEVGDQDMDELVENIYAQRAGDPGRPVEITAWLRDI